MFGPNSAPVASELLPDSSADCAFLLLTQFDSYFILDLDCSLVLLINLLLISQFDVCFIVLEILLSVHKLSDTRRANIYNSTPLSNLNI